jgi:hypothetical protein
MTRVFQVTEHNPFLTGTVDQAAERKLLERHGNANQLERYYAGLLPDDELCALARNVLFTPFAMFKRWMKLAPGDVRHEKGCSHGAITFTTRPAPDLTADEWMMYKKIRDIAYAADENVLREHGTRGKVEIVEHVGTCSICPAEVFGRAASIQIEWAGRPLSREYGLEAAR